MAFLNDLWESIFTPGPTPVLVRAANWTFGALQVLLAGLWVATWSGHFIVLSVVCGMTWGLVNWFVGEVARLQQQTEPQQQSQRQESQPQEEPDEDESEDETGRLKGQEETKGKGNLEEGSEDDEGPRIIGGKEEEKEGLRRRDVDGDEVKSQKSTEDDWERVSESGKDK